jgi:hypothetical protein
MNRFFELKTGKTAEKIIQNIDFSLRMEDMPLTEQDKLLLLDCLTGKVDINTALRNTIKEVSMAGV